MNIAKDTAIEALLRYRERVFEARRYIAAHPGCLSHYDGRVIDFECAQLLKLMGEAHETLMLAAYEVEQEQAQGMGYGFEYKVV